MNLFKHLFSTYPKGEVTPQDFIDTLSPGAPGWQSAWFIVLMTVVFGMLVYIIPIYLTEKDKEGTYPLWMHTFYFAADFMGIWVFLAAWQQYHHYPLFLALAIGEAIWVLMEAYSLQRAMTYEKTLHWLADTPVRVMLRDIMFQIVIFFASLNLLRVELNDTTMWYFWIFTQVLITTVPGLVLEKKNNLKGHNLAIHLTLIGVALVTFNPWLNMWLVVAPDVFSPAVNPWYYIVGLICLIFALRGTYIYYKLSKISHMNNER